MNQFVAPQFIDVEDRIIGPITTRQFVMMVIGGVVVFVAYKFLDTSGFILTTFIAMVIVFVFGFVKINGRRFFDYAKSMIEAIRRPKVRVWTKRVSIAEVIADRRAMERADTVKTELGPSRKTMQSRRLSEIALIVDTGGKFAGN